MRERRFVLLWAIYRPWILRAGLFLLAVRGCDLWAIYHILWCEISFPGRWMFNFFMRLRRVEGGKSRIVAAPSGPLTTQPVFSKMAKICRRSFSSRVVGLSGCGGSTEGKARAISGARMVDSLLHRSRCSLTITSRYA